jgi:hypothetical protein
LEIAKTVAQRFVPLIVVLFALTGCAFFAQPTPIPHRSEIVGTWVHSTSEGERSTLNLLADGTFTAESIPAEVFAFSGGPNFTSKLDCSKTQDLRGQWTLAKDRKVGDAPYLDVTIAPSSYPIPTQMTQEAARRSGRLP